MALTKSSATIIARGTSNAAFAQLTANAATTRSTTTATLTMASTATLTTGDYCLIQGHDIEEYNGVFQITVASGTTITYSIKQDPGASSGTTSGMTVDKVTFGTALDCTGLYAARVVGAIQNGNSAPGVAAQVWVGYSPTSTLADYSWRPLLAGDTTAKSMTPIGPIPLLLADAFVNFVVCRNTTNAVDVHIEAATVSAV